MEHVHDWSSLLVDILERIAINLVIYEDFMAFRGVCTSWRASVSKNQYLNNGMAKRKIPMLLLTEKDGESDERELYSLSKRKICTKVSLPEAKGKRCLDVGFGWILTIACSGGEIGMFKPFSRAKAIQLPNIYTFPEYDKYYNDTEFMFIEQAMLSDDPSSNKFVLMMITNAFSGFWRNGDENYTRIESCYQGSPFISFGCCHNEEIYALDAHCRLWTWDPFGTDATEAEEVWDLNWDTTRNYLVESTVGELLLIYRVENDTSVTSGFKIVRLDISKKKLEMMKDLHGDAIFLGANAPISFAAADYPGVLKPDCIYFTDDDSLFNQSTYPEGGGKDMGIYDTKTRTIERFDVEYLSFHCPPLWITISL